MEKYFIHIRCNIDTIVVDSFIFINFKYLNVPFLESNAELK